MGELITVDFKANNRTAAQKHLGTIDVIHAIEEFHQWSAVAANPEEGDESRLAAAGALLNDGGITLEEIEVRLAGVKAPSDDMVTLDVCAPTQIAERMIALTPREISHISRGCKFTTFEVTVSMPIAAKILDVAQAAGVLIQTANPLIRERLKKYSGSLNILPVQEITLPRKPC